MSTVRGESDPGGADDNGDEAAEVAEPTKSEARQIPHMELIATILMALAAILTAWSGFQAAKWSGVQANSFSSAGAVRTESTRASTTGGQLAQIDVATFLNWLNAAVEDLRLGEIPDPEATGGYEPTPNTPSGFLFERFRPGFEPVAQAWLATNPFTDPAAPATPFSMDTYEASVPQFATAAELEMQADELASTARDANQNGDNYVVMTIMSALVIFFAGLASKLGKARNQAIALGVGVVIFVGTVITVLSQPIEV